MVNEFFSSLSLSQSLNMNFLDISLENDLSFSELEFIARGLSFITSPCDIANFLFVYLGWAQLSNVLDRLAPPSLVGMKTFCFASSSTS